MFVTIIAHKLMSIDKMFYDFMQRHFVTHSAYCHQLSRIFILDRAVSMCIIVKCSIYYHLMCMTFGIFKYLEKKCLQLVPLLLLAADMMLSAQTFYCVDMVMCKTIRIGVKHQFPHSHTML